MLIIMSLSFIFLFVELRLSLLKRSVLKPGTKRSDKGSIFILWFVITLGFSAGFILADYNKWEPVNYLAAFLGLAVYISGMFVRWVSVRQLDKAFTVDISVMEGQQLITGGMYRKVRHPSYLGAVMIIAGIALGMNSVWSFLVVTIPVFLAFCYRIWVEESFMREVFGDKYAEYTSNTWRLIPFIF